MLTTEKRQDLEGRLEAIRENIQAGDENLLLPFVAEFIEGILQDDDTERVAVGLIG